MRETPLSKAVIQILKDKASPLSVPDLTLALDKIGLQPNKTTLYRMLDKMNEAGVIQTVLLDNKTTYYEFNRGHHHHHFVCKDCDIIECVSDPALEAKIHDLEKSLKAQGLEVKQHHFTLSGTCSDCR